MGHLFTKVGEDLGEADVFGVEVEPEVRHDEADLSGRGFVLKTLFELIFEERVQEHLFPRVAPVLVDLETTENKVLHVLADVEVSREHYLSRDNLFKKIVEVPFSHGPRHFPTIISYVITPSDQMSHL